MLLEEQTQSSLLCSLATIQGRVLCVKRHDKDCDDDQQTKNKNRVLGKTAWSCNLAPGFPIRPPTIREPRLLNLVFCLLKVEKNNYKNIDDPISIKSAHCTSLREVINAILSSKMFKQAELERWTCWYTLDQETIDYSKLECKGPRECMSKPRKKVTCCYFFPFSSEHSQEHPGRPGG